MNYYGNTYTALPGRVLGPCPCQVCGRLLDWDGSAWYFAGTRILHDSRTCPGGRGTLETVDGVRRARAVRTMPDEPMCRVCGAWGAVERYGGLCPRCYWESRDYDKEVYDD